jgi:hypothetical protein
VCQVSLSRFAFLKSIWHTPVRHILKPFVFCFCLIWFNFLKIIQTINFGLSDYVGSFGVPLVSVDCAICALYYYKVVMVNAVGNNTVLTSSNQNQKGQRQRAAAATIAARSPPLMVTPSTNIAYVF